MSYIFKVKVKCYGNVRTKQVRRDVTALVEADDLDGAMAAGAQHAENIVPSDVRWREFIPMEASRQILPYTLELLRS